MVEPDLLDGDGLNGNAELRSESSLEADSHVAETDCFVTALQQRPCDNADRIGEVDDPSTLGAASLHPLGDVQHDRDGSESFHEPTGTCCLLADRVELQRDRFVAVTCCLTAYSKLQQHRGGVIDCLIEIRCCRAFTIPVSRADHPGG